VAGAVPAAATVILAEAEAVCPFASVTPNVKVLVPAFAGFPDKTPAEVNPRPVLQAPEQALTDQT
jgi:hypothetical protein